MNEVMTAADASTRFRSASSAPSIIPSNVPLLSAFLAFSLAQFLKLFTTWYKEKRWDTRRMLGSGGMPSSHSATVTALAVAIGLQEGLGASAFAVSLVLACVVMYDATGVRLHAGRQAELLNQIVCELPPEHPVSNVRPLRDSLGHTPLQIETSIASSLTYLVVPLISGQVLAGSILGCIIAFLMRASS
ncbi:Acid phosphatase/vanadium-dependent haloperoxidase-related protein [Corchorus olitorius]|uniref:Acid phosphatase/vanadium-dependent haloperoxidase-related protein n=1 Tax=Corchorus olitorius TaxID=93759 RepID=A0A1R3KB90_9ROSI|nr:Acid phosphatase/vanadium-dependent haloperoxidase-related protein [Corchorus olitorius]